MNNNYQGTLIFMTDPICSWCWGTLPAIFELQNQFRERLEFKLKCAGLQVGAREPLTKAHVNNLVRLWHEVADVTGQAFSFKLPDDPDFIYHSELACRAIQIARSHLNEEPWELFQQLQHAFYVESRNLTDLDVLYELVSSTGIKESEFMTSIQDEDLVELTRAEIDWCEKLGISALPTVFLDLGQGPRLVAGGYATAGSLSHEITARLTTH